MQPGRKRRSRAWLRTAAALLLAGVGRAEVVVVQQIGSYFSPRQVVIQPGDTVRWIWTGGAHTVTQGTDGAINGNELFHSPLTASVTSYQFAFTPAFVAANPMPGGRYDYFCQPHFPHGMTGVVWVADPAPGTASCFGDGSGSACPCGANATAALGCPNSAGEGARLSAMGTASVSADTFVLMGSGAHESLNVMFFQGDALVASGGVFGSGLRCVRGTVVRLGTKAQGYGWSRYPEAGELPVSVRGFVQPGQTRYYQMWYFDSPSLCGPPMSNWSNAYTVTWQ